MTATAPTRQGRARAAREAFVRAFLADGCYVTATDAYAGAAPRPGFDDRHACAHAVDACHAHFHDAYHARFGGRRAGKLFGADPVRAAMRVLREMARRGTLVRRRVALGPAPAPGFPRWVLSYALRDPPPCGRCGVGRRTP